MSANSWHRRRSDDLAEHYGEAEPLVDRKRHHFPFPAEAQERRFDSETTPWLALVNARGPWGVWRHLEQNPPYIPMCLSLWKKPWWLRASPDLRNFCLEIWRIAAMEDWWGIFWGDPGQLWRRMGLDRQTFHARLEWMIAHGLVVYLTDEERAAAMAIGANGGEEEREKGGDKGGRRESRGETEQRRAEESREEALPPQAAEAEERAREQSGTDCAQTSAQREPRRESEERPEAEPEQRQSIRVSQAQDRVQGTEATRPVRVIGNPSPPCGIRSCPPESDGNGKRAPSPDSWAIAPPTGRGVPSLLGKSLPMVLRAAADPVKWAWLGELYGRLKFPYPMDSPLGRQELGAFESVYEDLMGLGLSHGAKMEILAGDLEWAEKNGTKRRNRRRGAVFCAVHHSRVATYLARDGPKR